MWLTPDGDIAVEDDARVHVFSDRGELLRTIRLEPLPGRRPPFVRDGFGDGTWLGLVPIGDFERTPGAVFNTVWQYHRYAGDGTPANLLSTLDARPRFVSQVGGITHYPFVPFTSEPSAAAGFDRFFIGTGTDPEVERRALAPRLRIFQIGRDLVLGRHLDEVGVERVRVYGLQRRDAAAGANDP